VTATDLGGRITERLRTCARLDRARGAGFAAGCRGVHVLAVSAALISQLGLSAHGLHSSSIVDSATSDTARAGIVDAMHVMSNAANRLVVSAQLKIRNNRDSAVARDIQASVDALLAEFERLRGLLLTLQRNPNEILAG
jgi:hypothetical protein